MIKIGQTKTIDLKKIEESRKWLDYCPDFYESSNQNTETEILDKLTLLNINNLYKLIREVTGREPDINNSDFNIGMMTDEQFSRYNHCIKNISPIDLSRLANQKLTEEERKQCEEIMLSCTGDNSNEIMKFVSTIDNFYLRTYTNHLLLTDNRSKYQYSFNMLFKSLAGTSQRINNDMKKIKKKEYQSWINSIFRNNGL